MPDKPRDPELLEDATIFSDGYRIGKSTEDLRLKSSEFDALDPVGPLGVTKGKEYTRISRRGLSILFGRRKEAPCDSCE